MNGEDLVSQLGTDLPPSVAPASGPEAGLPPRPVPELPDPDTRLAAWEAATPLPGGASPRLAAVMEHVSDTIGVFDSLGRITYMNGAGRAVLAPSGACVFVDDLSDGLHPDDRALLTSQFAECRDTPGSVVSLQVRVRVRRPSTVMPETWRSMDGTMTNRLDDPAVAGIILLLADVTAQRAYESLLVHQALHDPLTELPNRLVLLDRTAQALRRGNRHPGRPAVLFFDLDRFKVLNDTLGHAYGDRLLVAVAERVQELLRDEDTLARFGGDEFAVLCEDVYTDGEAAVIAQRILSAFERPFHVNGQDVFLSTSVGVALAEGATTDPNQLVSDADAAMYRAKELGRGRCEIFDAPLRRRLRRRLVVETALHEALPRNEFEVHYQPVFTAEGQKPVGVEALVRWRQGGELVSPAEFIPVAEEAGLIIGIDEFVLESACRQLGEWDMSGAPGLHVSVNLSPRHLASQSLVGQVSGVLRRTGVDPSRLILEVTESSFVSDLAGAQTALHALRDLGISVGVDDFGTGFSSLSYLRDLPVNILKIDRSFVSPLDDQDPDRGVMRDRAVVRAIVELAHSLGLRTVAEGVETSEQLSILVGLGCDYAQGFHLQRPGPPEEITALVGAARSAAAEG